MNDRELVLELARRLDLKEVSERDYKRTVLTLGYNEYVRTRQSITFGEGAGYGGFMIVFHFREDDPDKLARHECLE